VLEPPAARVFRQLLEALVFEGLIPLEKLRFGPGDRATGFASVELDVGPCSIRCEARIGAFDRFEIRKHSAVESTSGEPLGLKAALALLDAMKADPERIAAIQEELRHTVRLCEWNEIHLGVSNWERRHLSYEELDPRLHEGHPYHPCFKSRTGFSEDDHRRFGPEAGESFKLAWLAVSRAHLDQKLPCDEYRFFTSELCEATYSVLLERSQAAGSSFETHGLLPVHPWQWQSIADRYRAEIDRGIIIPLGSCGDDYRATQSLRTLMNDRDPRKAHLKLPMSLVNTSSLRTFEAPLVLPAPRISDWLSEVVASDRFFRNSAPLVILKEYAAALYHPVDADERKEGELGCIWRESVHSALRPGEAALPFNALSMIEGDGRPFIDPLIRRFGIERWLWRLLEATIPPVWRLLERHGIAIEAHAQNLILIHQDGWPLRLVARDFHESLERLPGDTIESLRELFMDTVFIYNLVELERLLRHEYGFSEATFWGMAGSFMTGTGHRTPRLTTESLMRKKLYGSRADEFHHEVANPFHSY
jgi:siderophore synthetase component